MAYTRWSDNQFYTYWSTESHDAPKEGQLLRTMVDCEHDYGYTYKYIKETGCKEAAESLIAQYQGDSGVELPEGSAEELARIFDIFVNDVDEVYA